MAKKLTSKSVIISEKIDTSKLVGIVTVIATKKAKHMETGKEYQVSGQMADTLIKNGFAELKK